MAIHPSLIAIIGRAGSSIGATITSTPVDDAWPTQIGTAGAFTHKVRVNGAPAIIGPAIRDAAIEHGLGDRLCWGGYPHGWISEATDFDVQTEGKNLYSLSALVDPTGQS